MKTFACSLTLLMIVTTVLADDAPVATKPVPAEGGTIALSPANTQINFIGTHEGPKPDPRKGGFRVFAGAATVGDGSLQSVSFEIETSSLYTEIPKLTNHLKSPDFFSVREKPKATFKSTSIGASNDPGAVVVKGDFTLLDTTKSIEIPAKVSVTPQGVTLVSSFQIDRTEYGMNYGMGRVKKNVALSVVIGAPTMTGN